VLLTIREEDFQRASISGGIFRFSEITLTLDEAEARGLYQSLMQRKSPAQFLTFDDAWRTFGGDGPLMEFVYLVTQGNTLYERLSEQVARLEDDVRVGTLMANELELLRLIAVASAYEARLQVQPLVKFLGLTAPKRTFRLFEKEYLLRLSDDGSLAYGLHPIRSTMLSTLITDPALAPWSASAQSCIPLMYEPDVETFLLHAFSRRPADTTTLGQTLVSYQTDQWSALAGGIRALIWLGVREYVEINHDLLREAYTDSGKGWLICVDYDIADAMPGVAAEHWQTLSHMMAEPRRQKLEALQARQTDKKQVFAPVRQWLTSRNQKPMPPATDGDWTALGEVLFWVGRLGVVLPLAQWLADVPLDAAIDHLPIEVLADVALGLSEGYPQFFTSWIAEHRPRIRARFRQTTQTVLLEDDGTKVTAHFIVEVEPGPTSQSISDARIKAAKDRFHEEAVVRIGLLRRLLPDRELYACQGYGHNVWLAEFPSDSTQKTGIDRKNLPPLWLTSVNSTFRGVVEREFRPKTWQEYTQLLFTLRQDIIAALLQLTRGLEQYFRSRQLVTLFGPVVNADDWVSCTHRLNHPVLLPSCALDEWGLTDEFAIQPISLEMRERVPLIGRKGLAFQAYKPYLDAFRSYTTHLSNFFEQSVHVMILNPVLGRNMKDGAARARVLAQAEQEGIKANASRLSTLNFAEAVKALPHLQREFRRLLRHLVDDAELSRIERQEQNIYRQIWNLWYFFDTQPQRVIPTTHKLTDQATDVLKRIRQALLREFRALSKGEVRIRIASEKALWDFEAALWVVIDGSDAIAAYQAFEQTIHAIRQAVRKVPETDLRRYLLDFYWPYVVIIPLVRGKLLTATVWRLNLPVLLQEGELQWWNHFQAQLPADTMADLGITIWQDTRLELAQKFLVSTTELSLYAAHIKDFLKMPDLDDEGGVQVQSYLNQISGQLGKAFQSTLDAVSIMVDTFNQLTLEEQAQRPNLITAVQGLVEMQSHLMPNADFEGQLSMNVTAIGEWAERLKRAREYAGLIYLFWASDILPTTEE
jgi:hypothetical protein